MNHEDLSSREHEGACEGADGFDVPASDIVPFRRKDRRGLNIRRLSKQRLEAGAFAADAVLAEIPEERRRVPRTFGDCEREGLGKAGEPCPWVRCRYNLLLSVSEKTGAIKLLVNANNPDDGHARNGLGAIEGVDLPLGEISCALRSHGMTLEDVGRAMRLTRERVRQIEEQALEKIRRAALADPELQRGLYDLLAWSAER
jgi:hypothetical protein